ncbi:neutral/alkaline non-lysosomal ceramidase N-terminal domain-containing protein [Leptospira stimsonii]|uniref:Neutral ceramidase n=1 Tax=Leptospira stimsonii TaxID=2202203 RepID=A0A396ZDR7_9LEPT|nr:neutral/alkaline non-lysosomal ceramidase N-terminal domain-containing protein [Leptospira stimsonii]RHX91877.1 alkaline ceramidase [Leptospira stimsonii]
MKLLKFRDILWILFFFLLFPIFLGCSDSTTYVIKNKKPFVSPNTKGLFAGASKVDITPPPGLPLAGYSMLANTEKGFRTKIYARVIYIRKDQHAPLVLIQTDLLSGSLLLHHRLAERLSETTDISLGGIVLSGTHTHSAPGNFYENNFYNEFAGNKPGFEKEWYEFLEDRIYEATLKAFQSARPAKIATGKSNVWGLTRNRSIEAYAANRNSGIQEIKTEQIYDAVNPEMTMIRIDAKDKDGSFKPLAVYSTYSIHGTSIPSWNKVVNADVFAYPERELELKIKEEYKSDWEPLHAVSNATHGDNSPDYREDMQGFIESKRLGLEISRKSYELFQTLGKKLNADVTYSYNSKEVDVYESPKMGDAELCSRPVAGTALTGGAEDGMTPVLFWLPFWGEGWPRYIFTGGCQGHKRTAGSVFQYLVLPKKNFPHRMILQTARIGDTALLAVPFEVTNESGRRFSNAAFDAEKQRTSKSKENITQTSVLSCTNGYFGYATTPEEYSKQHYEGGHTIFGPGTQPFLQAHLADLVKQMPAEGGKESFPDSWEFQLDTKRYMPDKKEAQGSRELKEAPRLVLAEENLEKHWIFRYKDVNPSLIQFHQPLISLQYRDEKGEWKNLVQDGKLINDSGTEIDVRLQGESSEGMAIYEVRWFNPEFHSKRKYRFTIAPRGKEKEFYSPEF